MLSCDRSEAFRWAAPQRAGPRVHRVPASDAARTRRARRGRRSHSRPSGARVARTGRSHPWKPRAHSLRPHTLRWRFQHGRGSARDSFDRRSRRVLPALCAPRSEFRCARPLAGPGVAGKVGRSRPGQRCSQLPPRHALDHAIIEPPWAPWPEASASRSVPHSEGRLGPLFHQPKRGRRERCQMAKPSPPVTARARPHAPPPRAR